MVDSPTHTHTIEMSGATLLMDSLDRSDKMAVTLRSITPLNYEQARQLSVFAHQERFVASIEKTLADAYVWSGALFRLAFEDDRAVGFVLVFPFEDDGESVVNIVRLMIDKERQGRGLGRELLAVTLDWIESFEPVVDQVRISTLLDNSVALNLYRDVGFQDHAIVGGEQVLSLELHHGSRRVR